MRNDLNEAIQVVLQMPPSAYAMIYGDEAHSDLMGSAYFYSLWKGSFVIVDVSGLPFHEEGCISNYLGMHIHEGSSCSGNETDPFGDTGLHLNPDNCPHPAHMGDLPPILSNNGDGLMLFYIDLFYPEEVIGHTLVIHSMGDDFSTQPSGNSGSKIACGEIKENS